MNAEPLQSAEGVARRNRTALDFVRFSWLKDDMLKEGILSGDWTDDDFATLKEACEIDASLFGKELGHWTIDIQPNANNPWRYDRRYRFWLTPMTKRCFWCGNEGAALRQSRRQAPQRAESILPDTFIKWGRYEIKASLCLVRTAEHFSPFRSIGNLCVLVQLCDLLQKDTSHLI